MEGFAQRPSLFIQLPMVNTLTFQTRSRPIQIIRNSDPLSATHIGLRLSPTELNGMMDRFSFPFVTTHFISESFVTRSRPTICHRAIFHAHFSPVFSTMSPTHSFTSFTLPLLSLFSTLLSRYRLAIRLTTLTNSYDLMTIPFILFLFFIHTLSFDEMRT